MPDRNGVIDTLDEPVAAARTSEPRFVALVNARAGEVLQRGEAAFADSIVAGFRKSAIDCEVRFVPPKHLPSAIESALDKEPDALLVAGGDGTVNLVLQQLIAAEVPVGLLPLGTLNLLARDIGLEGTLDDVVAQLSQVQAEFVDLGEVNGRLFHSNAGLGFFARMAREREDARHLVPSSKRLGFAIAALRSVWFHSSIAIELSADGVTKTYEADALLVTNNHFEGKDWRREALNTGKLEVHMLKAAGMMARVRAAIAVYRGTWRDLPHLQSFTTDAVTVRRHGRSRSTIALDGEIHRVSNPIRFRSKPGAIELISGRPGVQS